ncbi:glycoside hydrolase family 3 N-terminal domain-containing protein [Pseudarthrobacter sp. AL07]|nr:MULTISPECIES: glycoside hydrolase family 3 N-terminal domain-containing protein [unclassified Pseudarthrobacter]MDI3194103.1 glycoside hydrolase family 3 N-terminal domain-containing protein [Pseudarthrobacter sp. AL20]MDI3207936.1 glycoside hydrolase family 3 N-terminal domain-containing protein [Pseudarthrobacter sp. AL07]
MIGHIGAPELSRHFRPGLADKGILSATLAAELLQDVLRGELGFNGLILMDASQMVGLTQAMKRKDLVPATVAAGCDMFLFFRNAEEDFGYMLDGYKSGVITEQRLHDALRRILVKDTAHNLPIRPETYKRIRLYGISGGSDFTRADPPAYLDAVKDELQKAGLEVHLFKTAAQREAAGEAGINLMPIISEEATGDSLCR